MTKVHLLLIVVLQLGFNLNLTKAGSDREHVHIKVHIPEMIKKHTHVRKVQKHYFHPKKNHIPELDSSFAGGGFGALSYYPLGLGASEHTLHEYPMDFGQSLPLFPPEITPTSSHMATFTGGSSIDDNVMMNFMPEMSSKPKLKFVGNNKFYSKLSTKKFPSYGGNQFGQMMGNNVNIGGGGGGRVAVPGGGAMDHMNQMDDELRTKFHVDYDDDSNDELDDSNYSDESDVKTFPNDELMQMQMQNDMYSSYTPDSMASTSSIASNQYKKNLLPTYSQAAAGINADNSMAIKWYTDETDTPEWPMAANANESPTSMMKNSYTLPAYGSGHLPKKKKLQTMSEVSGQNVKFAAAAGGGGGGGGSGHDNERWMAKRKKAKYEKNRRRRPSRASSFYRFSY